MRTIAESFVWKLFIKSKVAICFLYQKCLFLQLVPARAQVDAKKVWKARTVLYRSFAIILIRFSTLLVNFNNICIQTSIYWKFRLFTNSFQQYMNSDIFILIRSSLILVYVKRTCIMYSFFVVAKTASPELRHANVKFKIKNVLFSERNGLITRRKFWLTEKCRTFVVIQWGSFPFGKSGNSPFYFPDREKTVKIFPVREIKWSIFLCLSILPGG